MSPRVTFSRWPPLHHPRVVERGPSRKSHWRASRWIQTLSYNNRLSLREGALIPGLVDQDILDVHLNLPSLNCWPVTDDVPGRPSVRSSSRGDFIVPHASRKFGDRAFSDVALRAWNRLPMELKHLRSRPTVQAQTENIYIYCWAPELNCKLNYVMRPRAAVGVGGALEIVFVLLYCIVLPGVMAPSRRWRWTRGDRNRCCGTSVGMWKNAEINFAFYCWWTSDCRRESGVNCFSNPISSTV